MKNIPIYRAKELDSDKYVEGYLFKTWNKYSLLWGTTNSIPSQIEIDPSTLAIHFPGSMIDKNKNRIFASLDNDYGIGGCTVNVLPKVYVTKGFTGTVYFGMEGILVLGEVPEGELSKDWGLLSQFEVEITGIQK